MSVYVGRLVARPLAFGLIGLWWAAFAVLMVADVIGRSGLALVGSKYWRALGPAVAFGGGVWLAMRAAR